MGSTKVSFPALHLNRMTPIKNSIQQSGSLSSSTQKDTFSFSIKFKIGDYILVSTPFKLVSACNQIPSGVDVRPRKNKTNKMETEPTSTSNSGKAVSAKVSSSKRRAVNEASDGTIIPYCMID